VINIDYLVEQNSIIFMRDLYADYPLFTQVSPTLCIGPKYSHICVNDMTAILRIHISLSLLPFSEVTLLARHHKEDQFLKFSFWTL